MAYLLLAITMQVKGEKTMIKYIYLALTSAVLLSFSTGSFSGEESTAASCLKLKINATKYADLIKGGGTDAQIRTWTLAKQDNENFLEDSSCSQSVKKY